MINPVRGLMPRSEIRVWTALGCSVGAIAIALALRHSLASVEGKLAAVEQALAQPAAPAKPPARSEAGEIAGLKERLVYLHDQVSAARSQAAGLAMALARTQQVLARRPAFAAFEQRLLGTYRTSRETSVFLPAGGDEQRGSDWLSMDLIEGVKGVDKVQAYGRRAGSHEAYSVRICARGILGVPGRYGHMGSSEQFFLVSEIIAVDAAAEAACKPKP